MLGGGNGKVCDSHQDIGLLTDQLFSEFGQPFELSFSFTYFNVDVLPLYVSEVLQRFKKP